jgi:hypothetical protein
MVQVAADEVIDMVAMGNGLVAATGAVAVAGIMAAAGVRRRAGGGVVGVNRQGMLLDAVGAHMMQVAVVEVIDMVAMLDGGVAATGAMLVVVVRAGHVQAPSSSFGAGCAANSAACSSAVVTMSATCRSANA